MRWYSFFSIVVIFMCSGLFLSVHATSCAWRLWPFIGVVKKVSNESVLLEKVVDTDLYAYDIIHEVEDLTVYHHAILSYIKTLPMTTWMQETVYIHTWLNLVVWDIYIQWWKRSEYSCNGNVYVVSTASWSLKYGYLESQGSFFHGVRYNTTTIVPKNSELLGCYNDRCTTDFCESFCDYKITLFINNDEVNMWSGQVYSIWDDSSVIQAVYSSPQNNYLLGYYWDPRFIGSFWEVVFADREKVFSDMEMGIKNTELNHIEDRRTTFLKKLIDWTKKSLLWAYDDEVDPETNEAQITEEMKEKWLVDLIGRNVNYAFVLKFWSGAVPMEQEEWVALWQKVKSFETYFATRYNTLLSEEWMYGKWYQNFLHNARKLRSYLEDKYSSMRDETRKKVIYLLLEYIKQYASYPESE